MSYERFCAANVDPLWFEDPERHDTAMRETIETVTLTGDGDQQFSGLHLNRDFSDKPAIVRLGAWFNDVTTPDLKYTAYQFAAANPENPVLLVDVPAHGTSDRLTPAQRREIVLTKQVSLVAASQASAARTRLADTSEIIVVGESAGARLSPDFAVKAGEIGLHPLVLIGFEMAGVDKRPSLACAAAFFIDGHLAQKNYHQGSDNRKLDDAFEIGFRPELAKFGYHGEAYDLVEIFKKEPSYLGFLLARSPLADDGGFAALERALDTNQDMSASLVSAGLSKVSRWRKIKPQVDHLLTVYPSRVSWDLWPNDHHSMGIAPQQPRQAAFTRAVIDSLIT